MNRHAGSQKTLRSRISVALTFKVPLGVASHTEPYYFGLPTAYPNSLKATDKSLFECLPAVVVAKQFDGADAPHRSRFEHAFPPPPLL